MENLERFINVLDLKITDKVPIFAQSVLPEFEERCRSVLSVEEFRTLRGSPSPQVRENMNKINPEGSPLAEEEEPIKMRLAQTLNKDAARGSPRCR